MIGRTMFFLGGVDLLLHAAFCLGEGGFYSNRAPILRLVPYESSKMVRKMSDNLLIEYGF